MAPALSVDVARDAFRGSHHTRTNPQPAPDNDNYAGSGHCPACNATGSLAPAASEYRGHGLIHHHWLCQSCGHAWVTVLHVSE